MEKSPPVEEEHTTAQLQHKLRILEEEWNSMKQHFPDPNPKTDRLLWRRSSSCTPSSVIINGQRVPECSPRGLMSSLQQQPPETRGSDLALVSGKLIKARRLFEEEEEGPLVLPDHLDAASEVGSDGGGGGSGGGRRSMTVARVCVLVALMASFFSGVRRFCSFGFGEEIMLVPT